MSVEPERILNERYRIESRLGNGGMAIVFCGTDLLLRRRVAIKVLRDQFASDDDFIKRFSFEAQSAAKLSHPNIVNVYDFGRQGDAYFIVMELVDGTTLAELTANGRAIPEPVAIDYAIQIAGGLAYAHRQGLLHRDIKPANILITRDDVVKLSDFGIARAVAENAAGVTQPGMVMGSVAYVSPEQAQGHVIDERSDLYSLGVVLYQMITGSLPFTAETPVAIALKHVSEPMPRLDPALHSISPALTSIITRLMEKNPDDRFSSATDLAAALREARERPAEAQAMGARADLPTTTFGAVTAPQPPPRRSASPDRQPVQNGAVAAAVLDDDDVPAAFNWRWPLLVLLLVVAVGIGYAFFHPAAPPVTIAVADYHAQSVSQAEQSLLAAGLHANVKTETSDSIPADRVIRQDPLAGSRIAANATVTLFVSSGAPSVAVPDVKGFTRSDAEHTLTSAKFRTRIVSKFNAAPRDTVLALSPAAGAKTRQGALITLIVSQGQAPVHVPQLVSLDLAGARALLAKVGLKLNVDQQIPSDTIPAGTIASQAIAADTQVDPGSTVGVTESTGAAQATVPNMSGKSAADALASLQGAGFVGHIQYIVDAANASGAVTAQDPAPDTPAQRHSVVTVNIAVPGTVPDISGMSLDDAKNALLSSGYKIGNVAETQDGTPGKAVRTEPEALATVRPGEVVNIYYNPALAH